MSRTIVLAVVASLLLSGCSTAGERAAARTRKELATATAQNLVAAARISAATHTDMSVEATTWTSSGITSVRIGYKGKNAAGTLEAGGVAVQLSRVSSYDFVSGPDTFWRGFLSSENTDLVPRLHGKWVSFTDSSTTFGKLAQLLNRQQFIATYVNVSSRATRAGEDRVGSVPCYVVKDAAGTLYLAKDDGRPIKIVDASGGVVTYRYDAVPTPMPPLDKDLVLDGQIGLS